MLHVAFRINDTLWIFFVSCTFIDKVTNFAFSLLIYLFIARFVLVFAQCSFLCNKHRYSNDFNYAFIIWMHCIKISIINPKEVNWYHWIFYVKLKNWWNDVYKLLIYGISLLWFNDVMNMSFKTSFEFDDNDFQVHLNWLVS